MARNLFFVILFIALCFSARSQQSAREDVLYLRNQWVIRGHILQRADSTVRIQTREGNIYVFANREIERIEKAPVWTPQSEPGRRWMNFTELGPLIAGKTTDNGVTTAAFSFQTIVAYRLSPRLIPGVGAGADLYATQSVIPLFATLRGDVLVRPHFSLYYFIDGGFGQNITQRSPDGTTYKGGALYAGGLGLRVPFNNTAGFLLSLGYRYQSTRQSSASQITDQFIYRRVALRAGFYL